MPLLVKGIGVALITSKPRKETSYYLQGWKTWFVRSNLQLALSSLAKDSSSSYHPWFEPIPSVEEDFGIDGDRDNDDDPHDNGAPYIDNDDYEDHNSSAFTTPCALDDLELYDITSRPQE